MAWMQPTQGGFQDDVIYKIESAADSTVLDLSGNKSKKGAKVITYPFNGGDNQKFRAEKLGVGFRLRPVIEGKKDVILDYSRKSGELSTWEPNNGTNQLFMAQEVSPGSQYFLIKVLDNNHCIRNNGTSQQVTLVPENTGDILQQWKIVPTY